MRLCPLRAYLWIRLLQSGGTSLAGAYFSLHQVKTAGLDPLALVLVGSALELAILLFEVPTGAVADAFGRKASFSLGFILAGAAFIFMGTAPLFWALLAGSLAWGLGETLISGARDAWIVDELPHSSQAGLDPAQVFLRGSRWSLAGDLMGVGTAALLILAAPYGAVVAAGGAALVVLGLASSLLLPERGFRPHPSASLGWVKARESLAGGIRLARSSRGLAAFLAVTLCFGLSSEGFDRLWQKHVVDSFSLPPFFGLSPDLWWAALSASGLAVAWLVVGQVQRVMTVWDEAKAKKILVVMTLVQMAAIAACALAGALWVAFACSLAVKVMRKANSPLLTAWLNSQAPPEIRATVLSLEGQADSVGQIVGGPIAGGIAGTLGSARWGLATSSFLLAPVVLLLGSGKRSRGRAYPESG